MHEHMASPAVPSTAADVELPLPVTLASLDDGDVVRPAYFSHKLCEFFAVPVRLIEVLHSPEIGGGESIRSRKVLAKIPG